MSIHSSDSIVHRRSNTKKVHPVVGAKQVSFHKNVIEPVGRNLIQIRMGECDERGSPEGQEDPQPVEMPTKSSVLKSKKYQCSPLYVNSLPFDLKSQQVILNEIKLETEKKEYKNIWNKHINIGLTQLLKVIKRDLSLQSKESIYKVCEKSLFS